MKKFYLFMSVLSLFLTIGLMIKGNIDCAIGAGAAGLACSALCKIKELEERWSTMSYVKPKKKITGEETLEILNSPWLTKYDVMQIAHCCDAVAARHIHNIREKIEEKGMYLPDKSLVPTEEVIKYFNINVSQLKKLAKEWQKIWKESNGKMLLNQGCY